MTISSDDGKVLEVVAGSHLFIKDGDSERYIEWDKLATTDQAQCEVLLESLSSLVDKGLKKVESLT